MAWLIWVRDRSRLKTLEETIQTEDRPSETLEPIEPWPTRGAVELDGVTVSYKELVKTALSY